MLKCGSKFPHSMLSINCSWKGISTCYFFMLQQMGLKFSKTFKQNKNSVSSFLSVLIWEIIFYRCNIYIVFNNVSDSNGNTAGNISKHPFWKCSLLPHNVANGEFLPGKGKVWARPGLLWGRGEDCYYCSFVSAFA